MMRVVVVAACLIAGLSVGNAQSQSAGGNIGHGKYLAEHVAMCVQCHTPRASDGTLIRDRLFDGAPIPLNKPAQLSIWAEFAPRIAGLPQYSSEQIVRLLTTGIGREGKTLRAPMPTFKMTREDAEDVASYLSSLK